MPTVWFIRHAESEANAGLRTTCPEKVVLTEKGKRQAEDIARIFKRSPDLIITSPYIRTEQTAFPTMQRFPQCPHEKWDVQEFTYLSPCKYQNTTLLDRRPTVNAYWERLEPLSNDGEGAESFFHFMCRVQETVQRLYRLHDEFVAVFGHEQFLRAVLWFLLLGDAAPDYRCRETMERFHRFFTSFTMPNGSLIKVQLQVDEAPWISQLMTSHLSLRA